MNWSLVFLFLYPFPSSAAFKSMESLYSSSSSKFSTVNLQRRKQTNGYPNINRFTSANPVQQRVMSARALRTKSLQSQLTMANHQLAELENENRLLKQLYNKNNFALARYESSNAELPRLLHSHQEEVRVLTSKCKNLQITNKDLAQKLKQKDSIILGITDQNRHLTQLNKDK
jgi:lebercilin